MSKYLIVILALLLASCRTKTETIIEYRDSIRTEVQERIVYVPDTVEVQIEREVEKVVVRDTISRLGNRYARSTAEVLPDGYLRHSLETIPQTLQVERPAKVMYKDSIVYRDRWQTKEVVKTKPTPLRDKLWVGLLGLIAGATIASFIRWK